TETNNQVLKLSCEQAIKANSSIVVSTQSVSTEAATLNIPKENVIKSLEVLEGRGYIRFHDSSKDSFAIPDAAFESYAKKHIPNYRSLVETALAHIVNDAITNTKSQAAQTTKPQLIKDHILNNQLSQQPINADQP